MAIFVNTAKANPTLWTRFLLVLPSIFPAFHSIKAKGPRFSMTRKFLYIYAIKKAVAMVETTRFPTRCLFDQARVTRRLGVTTCKNI